MLDIDENSSVEDDMFENVKTDEDMDHEMEEEEGGSAFEEEIDSDESDQQEQAVIPKSQTPFLSDKDTPESYGELIGFMEKFIEDQKAENDAFRQSWAETFAPLSYEGVRKAVKNLDVPVTRLMTLKQMTAFMDAMQAHWGGMGVYLTDPEALKFEVEFGPMAGAA